MQLSHNALHLFELVVHCSKHTFCGFCKGAMQRRTQGPMPGTALLGIVHRVIGKQALSPCIKLLGISQLKQRCQAVMVYALLTTIPTTSAFLVLPLLKSLW